MIGVGLYSCSAVDTLSPLPNTISIWPGFRRRFRGFGTGVISSERRRISRMRLVGCPSLSNSQWRAGQSYGEFRSGHWKN
jgi:hypothetical protein